MAEQFNVLHWRSTEAELLAQDVDAVYVASPAYAHCAQVMQAAYDAQQARETPAARQEYHLEGAGNYGEMVRDFSDCLLSGREPLVPLAEGRHSVPLVAALVTRQQP